MYLLQLPVWLGEDALADLSHLKSEGPSHLPALAPRHSKLAGAAAGVRAAALACETTRGEQPRNLRAREALVPSSLSILSSSGPRASVSVPMPLSALSRHADLEPAQARPVRDPMRPLLPRLPYPPAEGRLYLFFRLALCFLYVSFRLDPRERCAEAMQGLHSKEKLAAEDLSSTWSGNGCKESDINHH